MRITQTTVIRKILMEVRLLSKLQPTDFSFAFPNQRMQFSINYHIYLAVISVLQDLDFREQVGPPPKPYLPVKLLLTQAAPLIIQNTAKAKSMSLEQICHSKRHLTTIPGANFCRGYPYGTTTMFHGSLSTLSCKSWLKRI